MDKRQWGWINQRFMTQRWWTNLWSCKVEECVPRTNQELWSKLYFKGNNFVNDSVTALTSCSHFHYEDHICFCQSVIVLIAFFIRSTHYAVLKTWRLSGFNAFNSGNFTVTLMGWGMQWNKFGKRGRNSIELFSIFSKSEINSNPFEDGLNCKPQSNENMLDSSKTETFDASGGRVCEWGPLVITRASWSGHRSLCSAILFLKHTWRCTSTAPLFNEKLYTIPFSCTSCLDQ